MEQGAEDTPVVYLHDIKRQYTQGTETLTILDGAKLALWAGQSVALVAPSGAGKSTLLHIAGLLETPDEGEVYVGGAPTSQLSDIERTMIRRSDIAILRTMGASQGSIMRVFLITGAAIGVVGTLVGFFVGLLVCFNIETIRQFISWMTSTELFSPELYFLSKLPAEVDVGVPAT